MTEGLQAALRRVPLLPVISLAAFAVAWQLVGQAGLSPALPSLADVVRAAVDVAQDPRFQESLVSTGTAMGITFVPMIVAGVLVGAAMGTSRFVEWALTPYLNIMLSMPLVALVPIFLLIFGLDRAAVVAVIVAYALPAVIVNTIAGVQGVDRDQLAMAKSFGASRTLRYRRVVLPSSSRLVLAGVTVAAGRTIKGAVIAEQIIGVIGLGGLIQRLGGAFAVEELYAVVLFIGLSGIVVVWAVDKLGRKITPSYY
jgi:ABC-type nitrate/sulfonate/bicarbonate transport system permease component